MNKNKYICESNTKCKPMKTTVQLSKYLSVVMAILMAPTFISCSDDDKQPQKKMEYITDSQKIEMLKNHGYFACDIYSKEMLREYENNELHEDHDTFKIDWYTRKVKKNVLKHEITITENGDSPFTETYLEYYYDIMDISHKNLKLIKAVGDFNEDLKDEDERILLVFQKI